MTAQMPDGGGLTEDEVQLFENRLRWHFNVVAEEGKGSVYIGLGIENARRDLDRILAARLAGHAEEVRAARERALEEAADEADTITGAVIKVFGGDEVWLHTGQDVETWLRERAAGVRKGGA